MLTSSAASTLVNVETVIIDEIHTLAPTKHAAPSLALTLERLEEVTKRPPQRIGLSASARSKRWPTSSAATATTPSSARW